MLEDAVGTALGHALGHELVRRRTRREWKANGWCLHRHVSLARCASRARVWLLAFAVTAVGEPVAKPARAAGVALVPRIVTSCLGHQPGSSSLVGSSGGAGGGPPRATPRGAARRSGPAWRDGRGDLLVEAALPPLPLPASASCWRAARLASQPCMISVSQGRLMVAACSFRSSTSRMVNMNSMLPILSLMLSEAGASLMGQLVVEGTAAAGAGTAVWCDLCHGSRVASP